MRPDVLRAIVGVLSLPNLPRPLESIACRLTLIVERHNLIFAIAIDIPIIKHYHFGREIERNRGAEAAIGIMSD